MYTRIVLEHFETLFEDVVLFVSVIIIIKTGHQDT